MCVKLYCPPFCEFGAEWIEVCISEALLDANFGNDGKCCYDMRLEDSWLASHIGDDLVSNLEILHYDLRWCHTSVFPFEIKVSGVLWHHSLGVEFGLG